MKGKCCTIKNIGSRLTAVPSAWAYFLTVMESLWKNFTMVETWPSLNGSQETNEEAINCRILGKIPGDCTIDVAIKKRKISGFKFYFWNKIYRFVHGLKEGYEHLCGINSSYITDSSIIWFYSCPHTGLIFSCALSQYLCKIASPQ